MFSFCREPGMYENEKHCSIDTYKPSNKGFTSEEAYIIEHNEECLCGNSRCRQYSSGNGFQGISCVNISHY